MRRVAFIAVVLCVTVGCGDTLPSLPVETAPAAPGAKANAFDSRQSGNITGRVRWSGPVPTVPSIVVERLIGTTKQVEHLQRANPHAPVVDPGSRAMAGAVVFLRGIDAMHARPWDLPPVTIEVRDDGPIVRQGESLGLVGFAHRGDKLTMISKQPLLHTIRARGSAFFTLTLPEPGQARTRVLTEVGHVELTSGTGCTAMRGHLFVDDHPYYALTDADGRFNLPQVPAGQYELICWRPDWRIERQERDPETLLRARLYFHPPKEVAIPVTVRVGETATVGMEVE